jgi:uncharacterized protein (TIGR02588 family)
VTAQPENRRGDQRGEEISAGEWVVAALGLLLLLGSLGFALSQAVRDQTAPPSVAIRVDSVAAVAGGYLVRFRATNRGDETAADLTVEGELTRGPGAVERSSATVDYLPGHSERTGGLFFRADPRRHRLELRATGYQRP